MNIKMTSSCLSCESLIKRNRKYCDVKCQKDHQYKEYIQEWKLGNVDGTIINGVLSNHIKRYIFEKYNNSCSGCGISKWLNKPITLEIDHIDGNHANNLEYNLRLLCPNCHSQTPTYRAKNTGFGRKNRRKHKEK